MIDLPGLPERGEIQPIRLPDPALLLRERADRLDALAPSSAAGDYLLFLSRVVSGQARAVREVAVPVAPPGGATPIAPGLGPRADAWRRMLAIVLADARRPGLPREALDAIRRLEEGGAPAQEKLADAVLAGQVGPDQLASAPLVGAALQAFFGARTRGIDPAAVPPAQVGCPLCGSPPVAGVVLGDDRLRYLSCSLCGAQYHLTRIHCATCRTNAGITYFEVKEEPGVRAEACGKCRTYVKQFDLEKRPGAEPLADDVATLALDLLMAEEGFARGGVNLLLWSAAG